MHELPLPRPDAREPETLLRFAALAPSSHNSQPWLFEIDRDEIALLADYRRQLKVCDPDGRELLISCGCALFNLRVALAEADRGGSIALLPDPERPELLARIQLSRENAGDQRELAKLFPAIFPRRTHREHFDARSVPQSLLRRLAHAVRAEQSWLHLLESSDQRAAVTDIITQADEAQWADRGWRDELAHWMHDRRRGDGLVVPRYTEAITHGIVRSFDLGTGMAARDRNLVAASPSLAALGSAQDSPRDWLRSGMALQHLLLIAQTEGLRVSYLNQPIQVPSLRGELRNLLSVPGKPQILLRMGYSDHEVSATPRRALADLLSNKRGIAGN